MLRRSLCGSSGNKAKTVPFVLPFAGAESCADATLALIACLAASRLAASVEAFVLADARAMLPAIADATTDMFIPFAGLSATGGATAAALFSEVLSTAIAE